MNSLQIAFVNRGMPDRRYRLMVSLIRSDRPRVWGFLCMNCGSKICDLVNKEVYDATDFYDASLLENAGVSRDCKGSLPNGLACPYTYFFNTH